MLLILDRGHVMFLNLLFQLLDVRISVVKDNLETRPLSRPIACQCYQHLHHGMDLENGVKYAFGRFNDRVKEFGFSAALG
jgi:hypothetical protein